MTAMQAGFASEDRLTRFGRPQLHLGGRAPARRRGATSPECRSAVTSTVPPRNSRRLSAQTSSG